MTGNIDKGKEKMGIGLRSFFESYEQSIKDLFIELDKKGFLKKSNFTKDEIERFMKITENSNHAINIKSNFDKIFVTDQGKTEENIKKLGLSGWKVADRNQLAYQYGTILSFTYHAFLERLKNYFSVFILWDKIVKDPDKLSGIGNHLRELKKIFSGNNFLDYFNAKSRNSIAHFTFFWDNSNIYFCDGLFDKNPTHKSILEFMKEVNEVNVLVEGFHLAYRDHLGLPSVDISSYN